MRAQKSIYRNGCELQLNIDKILKDMHKNRSVYKVKGDLGEAAARQVLMNYKERVGGFIYLSYTYPYQSNINSKMYPGNLHWDNDNNKFISYDGENQGLKDEIDLLYVTPNKIFVVEVKARGGKWELYPHWSKQNGRVLDKCPVMQTEKHCRHLYHLLYEYLPEGKPEYIVPLLVFVDEATIKDNRTDNMKSYVLATILDQLESTLLKTDKPLDYTLNISKIKKQLQNKGNGTLY